MLDLSPEQRESIKQYSRHFYNSHRSCFEDLSCERFDFAVEHVLNSVDDDLEEILEADKESTEQMAMNIIVYAFDDRFDELQERRIRQVYAAMDGDVSSKPVDIELLSKKLKWKMAQDTELRSAVLALLFAPDAKFEQVLKKISLISHLPLPVQKFIYNLK